ncbi:hypothetical protein BV25DRAFT_1827361 [Artomyces pyxidatus]|uniref:Uncharacterized protein n=1 Tax=Artomyces pyxidatus TaxID=48021 RepID=A0ACB8SX32_9AGAM|nr:hypothetical protein BV25DRAFT_1827361 [Artomyces pyxidatus]
MEIMPNEEWRRATREHIEQSLKVMADQALSDLLAIVAIEPDEDTRSKALASYEKRMADIRALEVEEYDRQLRHAVKARWAHRQRTLAHANARYSIPEKTALAVVTGVLSKRPSKLSRPMGSAMTEPPQSPKAFALERSDNDGEREDREQMVHKAAGTWRQRYRRAHVPMAPTTTCSWKQSACATKKVSETALARTVTEHGAEQTNAEEDLKSLNWRSNPQQTKSRGTREDSKRDRDIVQDIWRRTQRRTTDDGGSVEGEPRRSGARTDTGQEELHHNTTTPAPKRASIARLLIPETLPETSSFRDRGSSLPPSSAIRPSPISATPASAPPTARSPRHKVPKHLNTWFKNYEEQREKARLEREQEPCEQAGQTRCEGESDPSSVGERRAQSTPSAEGGTSSTGVISRVDSPPKSISSIMSVLSLKTVRILQSWPSLTRAIMYTQNGLASQVESPAVFRAGSPAAAGST